MAFQRNLSPGESDLASMLLPAIFWSTLAFHVFSYILVQIVRTHLSIDEESARAFWQFLLEPEHPAFMARSGYTELLIGWLCFLHFKSKGLESDVLQPGRAGATSIVLTIAGTFFIPDIILSVVVGIYSSLTGNPPVIWENGSTGLFPQSQLFGFFLVGIMIAPVIEEFLFRGAFMSTALARGLNPTIVVIISSLGFALLHPQYTLFGLAIIFFLGVGLGAIRLWSGGLVLPIIAHATVNVKAFLASLALAGAN
ncbi:MAG: hypothetical protein CMK07_04105 [Ponticaulis sp.]|nr:hypothetical protein [Ponticaulis sp.]